MSVSPSAPFSVVMVSARHTVSGVRGVTHCTRPSAIAPGCGRSTEKCTSGVPGKRAVAAPEFDDVLHREAGAGQPRALERQVVGREGNQMQPGIARNRLPELVGERRVMRRGEHFEEAEPQPCEPVRRAARLQLALRVRVGLDVGERHAKAEPLELAAGRVEIGDEIPDMIEKDLVALAAVAGRPTSGGFRRQALHLGPVVFEFRDHPGFGKRARAAILPTPAARSSPACRP